MKLSEADVAGRQGNGAGKAQAFRVRAAGERVPSPLELRACLSLKEERKVE
jgi:hypothetical protein